MTSNKTSNKTEADMNAPETPTREQTALEKSGLEKSALSHGLAMQTNSAENIDPSNPPRALDRWFDEQLNRLFNDVSSEPLPTDLASLVNKLRSQGNNPDSK